MNKNKIIISLILIFTVFSAFNHLQVLGASESIDSGGTNNTPNTGEFDDIISGAFDWFNPSGATDGLGIGDDITALIDGIIKPVVIQVGGFIIIVVGIIIGLKYIWAPADGKAQVKESLVGYGVGVAMFFLATELYDFLSAAFFSVGEQQTVDDVIGMIWSTLYPIINLLAISGVIAIGLKYMLSPADVKGQIKGQLIRMVIGLILVYAIINVLNFFIDIGRDVLDTPPASGGSSGNEFLEEGENGQTTDQPN